MGDRGSITGNRIENASKVFGRLELGDLLTAHFVRCNVLLTGAERLFVRAEEP